MEGWGINYLLLSILNTYNKTSQKNTQTIDFCFCFCLFFTQLWTHHHTFQQNLKTNLPKHPFPIYYSVLQRGWRGSLKGHKKKYVIFSQPPTWELYLIITLRNITFPTCIIIVSPLLFIKNFPWLKKNLLPVLKNSFSFICTIETFSRCTSVRGWLWNSYNYFNISLGSGNVDNSCCILRPFQLHFSVFLPKT